MHIKQISIKGFKSYREEVRVTELPEGHVCVIGLNGSGKSNFFKAIQFVLCDEKFDRLSKQERISLLHEVSYEINDTVHFDFKNKEIGKKVARCVKLNKIIPPLFFFFSSSFLLLFFLLSTISDSTPF
jgi:chromosome segregation ATPase